MSLSTVFCPCVYLFPHLASTNRTNLKHLRTEVHLKSSVFRSWPQEKTGLFAFMFLMLEVTPYWKLNPNQGQQGVWRFTKRTIFLQQTLYIYIDPDVGGQVSQTLHGLSWLKREGLELIFLVNDTWIERKLLKSDLSNGKGMVVGRGFFLQPLYPVPLAMQDSQSLIRTIFFFFF